MDIRSFSHSEFDLSRDTSQNLTDFQTRVVWSSLDLRNHVHQMYSRNSAFNLLGLNYSDRCNVHSNATKICSLNFINKESALNLEIETAEEPRFWRPFTPEPTTNQHPTYARIRNMMWNKHIVDVTRSTPKERKIPTIAPSNIKLGRTVKSVFRSVRRRKYQCQFCCMSYLNQGQLAGHIRVHTGSKPYRCDYPQCSRAFARNEELTRHRRIHSGYKPHQCDVCQKQFGRKDHLNKHRKTHLKTSEKKVYMCQFPECGHRYTRSDALTRHQTTAHVIKSTKLKNV